MWKYDFKGFVRKTGLRGASGKWWNWSKSFTKRFKKSYGQRCFCLHKGSRIWRTWVCGRCSKERCKSCHSNGRCHCTKRCYRGKGRGYKICFGMYVGSLLWTSRRKTNYNWNHRYKGKNYYNIYGETGFGKCWNKNRPHWNNRNYNRWWGNTCKKYNTWIICCSGIFCKNGWGRMQMRCYGSILTGTNASQSFRIYIWLWYFHKYWAWSYRSKWA